ncbi:MAG: FAD-linked oxidase, partial [Deltaproteobacteria bacterium]
MQLPAPFPRPSAATVDKVRSALNRVLGDSKVITSEEGCSRYGADESEQEPVIPDAVVMATSAEDIAATLSVASEHQVPVTPRAGGTGKSGGAVPVCGGITLCTLGMNAIKEINGQELLAVVEPGLVLEQLQQAVEAEGLFYPPDPNSQADCALGGNIAENAGGPRALKYGVTRDYVLGLDVITATGSRLSTGRRTVKGVTGYDLTALL